MTKLGKLAVAAVAVAASLFTATAAKADAVTFSTYGTFVGQVDNNSTALGGTSTLKTGTTTVSYIGALNVSADSSPFPGTPIELGNFTFVHGTGTISPADKFSIFISQTSPLGPGTGSTSSDKYSVFNFGPNVGLETAGLPPTVTIGNEVYDLTSLVTVTPGGTDVGLSATLIGPAGASSPLPKSVSAGLGLLGLIAFSKFRSRGVSQVA